MAPTGLVVIATWYYCLILHKAWCSLGNIRSFWKLRKSCVFMFDIVRSLQKVKMQVLRSSKGCVFFLMIHKSGKNKRRSFSAATNLRTQPLEKKNAATKLNTQFFCNSKKKTQVFHSCLIKKRRFYAGLKNPQLFCSFLKNTQKSCRKAGFSAAFTQSCILFSQGNVGLKSLLKQGLLEPEFYNYLVYKFRKIVGLNDLSKQFRKNNIRYNRTWHNMYVMWQIACLVVAPIRVNNFAALFKNQRKL